MVISLSGNYSLIAVYTRKTALQFSILHESLLLKKRYPPTSIDLCRQLQAVSALFSWQGSLLTD